VCIPGARETVPVILGINGDGSTDPATDHTDNHIDRRLIITGENFDGAGVTVSNDAETWDLPICEAETTRLVVEMPADLTDGTYLLTVASQAGACSSDLPVVKGEKGDTGPQGDPGVPCTGCVDTATIASGAVTTAHFDGSVYGGSGSSSSVAHSDHGHDDATTAASGFLSTSDKSKLDLYSAHGGLNCIEEYDLIERGTNITEYWPGPAKMAELYQRGWICWNRDDDDVKVSPTMSGVHLNQRYDTWPAGSHKVCGRITYINRNTNYMLAYSQGGYYYGLRYLDGTTNTWHGRWNAGGGEGNGSVGTGDRWTIWTCR
jgi:hypothetical protein